MRMNNNNQNNERIIRQQFGEARLRSRGVDTLKGIGAFATLGGALLWGIAVAIEQVATFIKQAKK